MFVTFIFLGWDRVNNRTLHAGEVRKTRDDKGGLRLHPQETKHWEDQRQIRKSVDAQGASACQVPTAVRLRKERENQRSQLKLWGEEEKALIEQRTQNEWVKGKVQTSSNFLQCEATDVRLAIQQRDAKRHDPDGKPKRSFIKRNDSAAERNGGGLGWPRGPQA